VQTFQLCSASTGDGSPAVLAIEEETDGPGPSYGNTNSPYARAIYSAIWRVLLMIWHAISWLFTGRREQSDRATYSFSPDGESVLHFLGLTLIVNVSNRSGRARDRGMLAPYNVRQILNDLLADSFREYFYLTLFSEAE
jgi:hypothetical protein